MVEITIKEAIYIKTPPHKVITYLTNTLRVDNPEYIKRLRLKKWIGKTPKTLDLFEIDEETYIIPFGMKQRLKRFLTENDITYKVEHKNADIPLKMIKEHDLSLYDYQKSAVNGVLEHNNGILISPAGSGKTRMAMEIIGRRNQKTLWITNNLTLLKQSKKVFKQFYSNKVGEISAGKVNIQDITFATVQTLSKVDLNKYRDTWGLIVVDECHRIVGGPTKVMQFYKVLSNLNAKYKYGITATLFDKPNDISSTPIFLLGDKLHEIKKEDVKRVTAKHVKYELDTPVSDIYLNPDKTIDYIKLINYLVENEERNIEILYNLIKNKDNHNLVLSSRNEHIKKLSKLLNNFGIENEVLIGTVKVKDRVDILKKFEKGEINFILSNYQLAKEGLDLPIADTLHLVAPMREKKTIIQSAGRVERIYKGKETSTVYDYVDKNHFMLVNMYNDRRRHLNAKY